MFTKNQRTSDPLGSRVAKLTPAEVAYVLAFVCRNGEAALIARQEFTGDLFNPSVEAPFLLLWRSVSRVVDATGSLPVDTQLALQQLGTACMAEAATDNTQQLYTPAVIDAVTGSNGLLQEIFVNYVEAPAGTDFGFQLLGRFLSERKMSDPLRTAIAGLQPGESLADPVAILKLIEEGWRSATTGRVDPGASAVPSDPTYRPPLPSLYTTGMPWLDVMMNGGHTKGEAYCVLGGTKSGKSSFATQLATEGALRQTAIAMDGGMDAGYWYYFSWELTFTELQQRILSYGARVHHDTYRHEQRFSDFMSLKPYELDAYVNPNGLASRGEIERLQEFALVAGGPRCRLRIVDFSGRVSGSGDKGLQEAIDYLKREQHRGRHVAGVILDYAGLCIQRMIKANAKMKPSDLYEVLTGYMDDARFKLAIPFSAPTWVLHQLHGDQASRAPGVALHHKDARGSRNIGDNADFAFCIGNRDMRTNLLAFSMSAARRAAGRAEPLILHFDPRFGAFNTPTGSYVIDPYTQRIVDSAQAATLGLGHDDMETFSGFNDGV